MKILVAEDDPFSMKILVRILQGLGHEIEAFKNGRDALEHFKSNPTSIVISDWMMPEMDGLKLCQEIRSLDSKQYTHFIMLTAKSGVENYREAMAKGVDDFLTKPVNKEALTIKLRVTERIIRQRKQAEKQIRTLAQFPEDNPNPVLRVDRQAVIRYVNQACHPLLKDWEVSEGDLLPPRLRGLLQPCPHRGQRQDTEITCGDQVYSFAVTSIYNGETTYLYGHNITDRKKAEQELVDLKNQAVRASLHDQLTGLPNRILFNDRLSHDMARCQRQAHQLALVMVDIDNFKAINDSQGHQTGDEVLTLVGDCLRNHLRESDTICRWGGDEMVLLLPDLTDRSVIPAICSKLNSALQDQLATLQKKIPLTLSMGYAVFPDDSNDPELLMRQADHALYRAKSEGRNCWREFTGFGEGGESKGQADLYISLSEAVKNRDIQVHFQPIIDGQTRAITGMEALARWHDKQLGWVLPDQFIPMAEDRGLILPLGQQVIQIALSQLAELRDRGKTLTLSINLARTQLLDPDFLPWLVAETNQLNLDPGWIILEITERQSLLNHADSRLRLEELDEAGFRLSLDDFGTGYAALDLVGEMPFDELKIPRPLIRKVENAKGLRIVQAIVDMARSFGMKVVAEGVETAAMVDILQLMGTTKLQGYFFSKALPRESLFEFVETYKPPPPVEKPVTDPDNLTMLEPRKAA